MLRSRDSPLFAGHNLTHPNRHRLCSAGCISTGHSLRAWQVRFPHIFGAMCGLKACSLPSIVLTAQSHRHPPSFGLGTCETRLRPVAVAPIGAPSPSLHRLAICTTMHACTHAPLASHVCMLLCFSQAYTAYDLVEESEKNSRIQPVGCPVLV